MPDNGAKIIGGCFLKPREDIELRHCAPCVREVDGWLLENASFQDGYRDGIFLKRGQVYTSIDGIRDGLHWFKGYAKQMYTIDQVKKALTKLRTKARIEAPTKAPGGIVITICNYDHYQTFKNYEGTNESTTKAPTKHHEGTDTLSKATNDEGLHGLQNECNECDNERKHTQCAEWDLVYKNDLLQAWGYQDETDENKSRRVFHEKRAEIEPELPRVLESAGIECQLREKNPTRHIRKLSKWLAGKKWNTAEYKSRDHISYLRAETP